MADPQPLPPKPVPPEKPLPGDCCGDGCAMCVNDVYEQQLEDYEKALAAWQARNEPPAADTAPPGAASQPPRSTTGSNPP
jgi:hypothetical protein